MGDSTGKTSAAALVNQFLKYLNDEITSANAQDFLQIALRTEDKIVFDAAQIARICNHWAIERYEAQGIPIFQSLCASLLRIYQANAYCTLPLFKLDSFIKPFLNEVFRLCPAEERDMLKEELPNVRREFQKSQQTEVKKLMPEYEVQFKGDGETNVTEGEWIQITGEKFQQVLAVLTQLVEEPLIDPAERMQRIKQLIPMIKDTFTNIIHETVLKERLIELIRIGQTLFNRNEIEQSNLILGYVVEVVDQRKNQFLEKEVSSYLSLDKLNNEIIDQYVQDPDRKVLLKPLFFNIFETRPNNLLAQLVQEGDAEKRKKLLSYLTVFEPEIFYQVLQELNGQMLSKWYFRRNLIYLLTKIQKPADISIEEVLETLKTLIHPEVYSALVQEGIRSYLFFDCVGGTELVIKVLRAQHVSDVIHLEKFYPPQILEEFKNYLITGVASFDLSPYPQAVGKILQAVREELSKIQMKIGKLTMGLNQKLVIQLISMLASSTSPSVISALKDLAETAKVGVVQNTVQDVLKKMQKEKQNFI